MAPVYVACSLSLQCSFQNEVQGKLDGQKPFFPPFLSGIPAYLRRCPAPPSRRRRSRRRGRRGGRLVKLKACYLFSWSVFTADNPPVFHRFASWRFSDPIGCCLVPVAGLDKEIRSCHSPSLCLHHRRGVFPNNRGLPAWASQTAAPSAPASARIALVNARSLANKTFILKEFFTARKLDFLCVTETWMSVGESSAFSELLPADCGYFNTQRASGHRGVATVYKTKYFCTQRALLASWCRFKANMFELGSSFPVHLQTPKVQ